MATRTPDDRFRPPRAPGAIELRSLEWDQALRLRPYSDVRASFAPWRRAVLAHWDEWSAKRRWRACS